MVDSTSISWTQSDDGKAGATWNPTDGCECCSPGCKNCYAMRMAGRFSAPGRYYNGLVTITKKGKHKGKAVWNGTGRLNLKALRKPMRWREPRRVFVNSMSDLFFERFTNEEIAAVFGVMAITQRHTFQVLTKRGARMRAWYQWLDAEARQLAPADPDNSWWRVLVCIFAATKALGIASELHVANDGSIVSDGKSVGYGGKLNGGGKMLAPQDGTASLTWPLPNVWVGVSVDDRKHGLPRIDELRAVPAVVRFLSCEPLLESLGTMDLRGIHWVIAGCESGPDSRPFLAEWAREIRDQTKAAGGAFFLKQAAEQIDNVEHPEFAPRTYPHAAIKAGPGSKPKGRGHGGRVYELPYLDARQWREFPSPSNANADTSALAS